MDLQRARIGLDLGVCELARRAGITHKAVQYWEVKPALDLKCHAVKAMADALGVALPAGEFLDPNARTRGGVLSRFATFSRLPVSANKPPPRSL